MAGTALLAPARCGGLARREGGASPVRRGPTRLGGLLPDPAKLGRRLLTPSNTPPPGGRLPGTAGAARRREGRGVPDGARALASVSAQFFRLCDRFMPREARNSVNQAEEPHGGHR